MPKLEIVVGADATLVLPCLVIANYLTRRELLPDLTKSLLQERSLGGAGSLKLVTAAGKTLTDRAAIQYLTKVATNGTSRQQGEAIAEWVGRSEAFASKEFQNLRKPLEELDAHLILRTYIVGYDVTVADLAVWATIRASRIALGGIRKPETNVYRWYTYIEATSPWLSESVAAIIAPAQAERAKARAAASAAGASYEIDIPDTDSPVVTRFPPEPSGYLHIGHVKAAILNDYFAHKRPGGTLICRFDDTNPTKESTEFQDAILEDLRSIEIVPDRVSYSSDHFQVMHDFAVRMIQGGKAFADDSPLGKGAEVRRNRLPSKRRDLSVRETLARFEEMKSGSEEGQKWCLRARVAYDSPNGALRDPVIYRRVWGWDDPRMPTVRGILRRGMTVAALREFIIRQGPGKNILNLEWGVFWATNKKYIDPVAPRHTAVVSPQAVHCRVRGLEGPGELVRPKHLKNPGLGSKRVVLRDRIIIEQADAQTLQPGDEVTLMNWGNAFVRDISRDQEGKNVTAIDLELHLDGDVKKTKKLTWLAAADDNLVPIDIVSFDYLLTKDRLEKDDDPENFLTPVTESREQAFADCNVKDLPKGAVMQFDRKGFFKVDAAYQGPGSKVVFFDVPFGNPG